MKTPFEVTEIDTGKSGPHILLLGRVHGNEPCGTHALERLIADIDAGVVKPLNGKLTIIPTVNVKAAEQNLRFIDRNLNRELYPKENPQSYEDQIGNALCPYLADCDVLLDLHSVLTTRAPFVMLGPAGRDEEYAFARALGSDTYLYGFADAFRALGREVDPRKGMGTTEYARSVGAKAAITYECGQHDDPQAIENAYQAVLRCLTHYEVAYIAASLLDVKPAIVDEACIKVSLPIIKTAEGTFAKPWKHLDRVDKGALLAVFNNGAELRAPFDAYVLFPVEAEPVGEDWFYLGEAVSFDTYRASNRQPTP